MFVTAYDRFVSAVGLSEVKRRDAHLAETLRNRSILLYSNIGVSLLFFIAILTFFRSARDLEKTLLTARQVAHTKQVFLASINHELRNPLQTIVSATENISHYATNRELMRAVTNIDQAVKHIETHMRDLTDYLQLRTNKINLRVCSVDLQEIASEVIRRFKPKASEKGIRLQANFDGPTTRFLSDEQRVQQIIVNLVENSIKYSSGGVILIQCSIFPEFHGNGVTVQVIDEGIGIEKNEIEFLFSPFYQSPLNDNSQVSGYGMGLAVVRGLVEVLGGSIAVKSDVGKGAVFTVKLPYETHLIKHTSSLSRPDSELTMLGDQEW
ncbi:sensor histidine kinase [Burkholderia ambifaria]|uniref:histidine kinase n=1 Tax=Burkholderia ambifaria MEX-5 TaxID=396597 RepID=B1T469_9BURK|nr:HAMP domain-containing sensor histidine kinase [Burkholderia ambifaria]EDT41624.1 histidine kinase [Burkholderia ambifaria MEX-5]